MLSEDNEPSTFTISDVELESVPETSVEAQKCEFCNSNIPNWSGGPAGKATLCNACDLRWNSKNKEGCQANQLEGEEIYQLDCRNGEAVPFVSKHSYDVEQDFNTRGDGSGYSSFDEGAGRLAHEEYGDGENLSSDGGEGNEWEEDYGKLSNELSMDDEESDDRLGSHASAEEGDDEAFLGVVKMESGKENYYCKYCDTSWPYSHFRNAQQFGAHCSNCSRKRKVKDPQELTIRERNKRLRKAKKVSPLRHDKRSHPRGSSSDHSEVRSDGESMSNSSEEDFDNAALAFLQRAVSTAKTDHREKNSGEFKKTSSRASVHAVRKRKFEDFTDSSAAEDKEPFSDNHRPSPRSSSRNSVPRSQGHPKRNKHNEGKKAATKSKKVKAMVIITPEKQDDHASIAADPNSLGGLLGAIERKLTAEKKKREMTNMKQNIWAMRQEVSEQYDSNLEDLRFRSVALVQELRVDMIAKLEALKIDLASELSFRESRRKKRLNEMRIQMNALNRILESGKKERENGVLLSTFGGKFDTALKQLEDLKVNLQKEFTTREQAMQQQFTEMRATCSLHLANMKQQMHDELNMREGRMQKELEDMKHKLHSVCSQIGAENYCPESPPMPAHSPTPVLPTPEKFTTTTTTTTTTTITHTNINTNSPLGLSLVASLRPMVPHLSGLKPTGPAKQLPSDLPIISSAVGQKAAAAQQNLPFECLPGLSGATSLEC